MDTARPGAGTRVLHAVRDGWLVIGVTLALFLVIEGGYRTIRPILRPARASTVDSTQHPYATAPWWPQLQRETFERENRNRYDPYRAHWPRPLATRYVNIDTAGHRVTPQPPPAGPAPRRVYLLGGSTMWGIGARDSATIPALVAAALRERGIRDVEVVNLAQRAYNTTQESVTLLLELANGRVPAAAVFLDGFNDITTAIRQGEPGHTFADDRVDQLIRQGQAGFWSQFVGLGRHSLVVMDLLAAAGMAEAGAGGPYPARLICGPVAARYRQTALAVEALGRGFGFPVRYFLQPVLPASHKPPSAWEKQQYTREALGPCMAAIDSAMADHREGLFVSLVDLFDADTATVFLDRVHLTEAANRRVAERIADELVVMLGQAPGAAGHGATASIRPTSGTS